MSEKRNGKNNFIMQAGILAAAGIVSRIIGLLYRSPLHSVIGDAGMGYFQAAHAYYTIVLLISSYSIPSAISKVIAQKLAVKEYRNAHRIFRCAILYVLVVGGVAGLFLYFGAGLFVEENAIPVLRVFAPTIFVYGLLGVLRGYFQAHKSMVQTSVSQILEQIANAVVSIGAAYGLILAGMGTMEVPGDTAGKVARAVKGAMGSAMGTGAGVAVALLFMLGIYWLNQGLIHRRIQRDQHEQVDSFATIFKMITAVVTPFILSTAVYNLSSTVNTKIYTSFYPEKLSLDSVAVTERWGIFSGQALTISNIPIAFASAMAAAIIPSVAQLVAARDLSGAREKIGTAVKTTMVISIPCAVGILVLAKPITNLLFPSNTESGLDLSAKVLMALSLSIIFYALSTLNSSVLQGLGRVNVPIRNAAIALALQTVTAVALLFWGGLDLYGIAIANTVYSGTMCVLNQISVRRAVDYRQEYLRSMLIPFASAALMGVGAWLVYEGLFMLTEAMVLSVLPAVVLAVFTYFGFLIKMGGLTEEELRGFPKGHLLLKVAKKLRLL